MKLYYSHPNAISIFTDVSTTSKNVGFICPGFIAVQGGKGGRVLYSDYRVLNGSSSQFGELYAIMMALTFMNIDVWAKRNRGLWQEVDTTVYNLFSDSVYALTCLKKVPHWVSETNAAINRYTHPTFDYNSWNPPDLLRTQNINKKIKKNRGEFRKIIVPNQEVILHCMGLIVNTQKQINTYHIKGHIDRNNPNQMDIARNDFKYYNPTVETTEEELKDMLYWNDMIDTTSREHLRELINCNRKLPKHVRWPVRFYPTPVQQMLYQKFIR